MPEKQKQHTKQKQKKKNKSKSPFFPDSPTTVGSPRYDGFYKRTVRQRTPNKICSLVLPPPSLDTGSSYSSGNDVGTTSATRPITTVGSSDNASLDGHSTTFDNANTPPVTNRHSSNASIISASVASMGGIGSGGSTTVPNNNLPLHLRVGMAPCDPILVFNGKFVLVATCDARIAIYSIVQFDNNNEGGISEDVLASERRKRAEWREEDNILLNLEEEKKEGKSNNTNEQQEEEEEEEEEEENEWEMRDRMHQREKAKQNVEPILIVTLSKSSRDDHQNQQLNSSSYDDESTTFSTGNIVSPPTIVAICATPGIGESLIEQKDPNTPSVAANQTETVITSSKPMIPSFDNMFGHVAVLTGDGEVHVLEFLCPPASNDILEGEEGSTDVNEMNHNQVPIVNTVLSFNTGHLGATCICMHQAADQDPEQIRICVGHQSGIITSFHIYSDKLKTNMDSSTRHKRRNTHSSPDSLTRSKSNELDSGESNIQSKAAPRVLFGSKIPIHRTNSEPIDTSCLDEVESSSYAMGPAKVLLCWKGALNVPIRSLSSPGWVKSSKNEHQMKHALLVVGLEQRQRENATVQAPMNGLGPSAQYHSLSPAISVEVINTTLAEEIYSNVKSSSGNCISFHDCSVWPASGREIKDGWMRGGGVRRGSADARDKLFETLQRTSVTNKICKFTNIHKMTALYPLHVFQYSLFSTYFSRLF